METATIRFPEDMLDEIEDMAEEQNYDSRSEYIRAVVRSDLYRSEQGHIP